LSIEPTKIAVRLPGDYDAVMRMSPQDRSIFEVNCRQQVASQLGSDLSLERLTLVSITNGSVIVTMIIEPGIPSSMFCALRLRHKMGPNACIVLTPIPPSPMATATTATVISSSTSSTLSPRSQVRHLIRDNGSLEMSLRLMEAEHRALQARIDELAKENAMLRARLGSLLPPGDPLLAQLLATRQPLDKATRLKARAAIQQMLTSLLSAPDGGSPTSPSSSSALDSAKIKELEMKLLAQADEHYVNTNELRESLFTSLDTCHMMASKAAEDAARLMQTRRAIAFPYSVHDDQHVVANTMLALTTKTQQCRLLEVEVAGLRVLLKKVDPSLVPLPRSLPLLMFQQDQEQLFQQDEERPKRPPSASPVSVDTEPLWSPHSVPGDETYHRSKHSFDSISSNSPPRTAINRTTDQKAQLLLDDDKLRTDTEALDSNNNSETKRPSTQLDEYKSSNNSSSGVQVGTSNNQNITPTIIRRGSTDSNSSSQKNNNNGAPLTPTGLGTSDLRLSSSLLKGVSVSSHRHRPPASPTTPKSAPAGTRTRGAPKLQTAARAELRSPPASPTLKGIPTNPVTPNMSPTETKTKKFTGLHSSPWSAHRYRLVELQHKRTQLQHALEARLHRIGLSPNANVDDNTPISTLALHRRPWSTPLSTREKRIQSRVDALYHRARRARTLGLIDEATKLEAAAERMQAKKRREIDLGYVHLRSFRRRDRLIQRLASQKRKIERAIARLPVTVAASTISAPVPIVPTAATTSSSPRHGKESKEGTDSVEVVALQTAEQQLEVLQSQLAHVSNQLHRAIIGAPPLARVISPLSPPPASSSSFNVTASSASSVPPIDSTTMDDSKRSGVTKVILTTPPAMAPAKKRAFDASLSAEAVVATNSLNAAHSRAALASLLSPPGAASSGNEDEEDDSMLTVSGGSSPLNTDELADFGDGSGNDDDDMKELGAPTSALGVNSDQPSAATETSSAAYPHGSLGIPPPGTSRSDVKNNAPSTKHANDTDDRNGSAQHHDDNDQHDENQHQDYHDDFEHDDDNEDQNRHLNNDDEDEVDDDNSTRLNDIDEEPDEVHDDDDDDDDGNNDHNVHEDEHEEPQEDTTHTGAVATASTASDNIPLPTLDDETPSTLSAAQALAMFEF
jgi:hypothetical protein